MPRKQIRTRVYQKFMVCGCWWTSTWHLTLPATFVKTLRASHMPFISFSRSTPKEKNKETPFFLTIPFLLSRKAHLWARHLATYPFPDLRLFFCFFFPQITFVLFRSELSIFLRHLFCVTTEYQIIPDWLWGLTLFWEFRVFFFCFYKFRVLN